MNDYFKEKIKAVDKTKLSEIDVVDNKRVGRTRKDGEELKTERLQIKVTKEQKEQIRWLAELDNRSISNYILNLCHLEYERLKKLEGLDKE